MIVEEGYKWENDKLFVGNITEEQLNQRIGAVQIGDIRYEKGDWTSVIEFIATTITIGNATYDGFYINTIPEPAEWVMIFGAIALAFVVYRRK